LTTGACQGLRVTLSDIPGAETDAGGSTRSLFHRYVAIGDSWTEGVGDPDPARPNGLRGWADRVAEALSAHTEDFGYANLAIRGRTVEEILDEQLQPALDLRPDLLSIQGAGNDLLHVRVDIDALVESMEAAVVRANEVGACVVLFTHGTPAAGPFRALRGRVAIFNELIREVVDVHDAVLVDNWRLREARDPRYWDVDRIHLSPFGHHLAAQHVLGALGLEHEPEPMTLPDEVALSGRERLLAEIDWARTFAGPWIYRRLTGRSLGDGITPKRPVLAPI
jgi:lysophospholipase L1-like esterase